MKVGIIGAGASGMMAAISASESGYDVTILEKNSKPGYKILQTGNGKCNFTNAQIGDEYYAKSGRELFTSVYSQFNFESTIDFFNRIGIVPYVKNGYYYPKSEQAKSVADCLLLEANRLGVDIICDCEVVSIDKNDKFTVTTKDKGAFIFDKLIIAAGSNAVPKTGSDGSGYGFAIKLGHKIKKPLPALCSLKCDGTDFKAISGVRCQAKVKLMVDTKVISEDIGEVQHTDYGISGIPVFQISGEALRRLDKKENVSVSVDYAIEYTCEDLFIYLKDRRMLLKNRKVIDFLEGMFNSKLCEYFLEDAIKKYGKDTLIGDIQDEFLVKNLESKIKGSIYRVKGHRGFDNCQICTGGIYCDDVKSTLESKIVDGLYFCGEILDVDGLCGGYNLQWAWSSGYVAGKLI